MKKYLIGLIAIISAVVCFSFSKSSYEVKSSNSIEDCAVSNKKWFIILLDCNEQNEFEDYLNGDNYRTQNYPGEVNDHVDGCFGNECLCAIYCCAQAGGVYGYKPYIPYHGDMWWRLKNYYDYGSYGGGMIREKNTYEGRKTK